MKLTLVAVALVLLVLPIAANAYIVQGGGNPPEVTFGTGHVGSSPSDFDATLVVLGPQRPLQGPYYSSYFVTQDPGQWTLKAQLPPGSVSGWFHIALWVTDLGAEGPSQQLWTIQMNNTNTWGSGAHEIYRGALFSTTGTSANPNFVYNSDFVSGPLYFKLTAIPEPGSVVALLGGLFGMAGIALRRQR